MKTQIEDVKKYLETHKKGITSLSAIGLFGVIRLSAIIYVLRNKYNMNIITENKTVKNRYGRNVTIANYKMVS